MTSDYATTGNRGQASRPAGSSIAYTGTVHALGPSVVIAAVCLGLVLAAMLLTHTPRTTTLVGAGTMTLAVGLCVGLLGRLGVGISRDQIRFRPGWGRWQEIDWAQVTACSLDHAGMAAVVGVGVPMKLREYRHIIAPGPALHLHLGTGEDYWLSLPRNASPEALAPLLDTHSAVYTPHTATTPIGKDPDMTTTSRKPWFGPKRIGWGVGPTSWQGWLIVALVVVALVIAYLRTGHL